MKKLFLLLVVLAFLFSPLYAQEDGQGVRIIPLTGGVATSDTITVATSDTVVGLPDVGPISVVFLTALDYNLDLIRVGGKYMKSTAKTISSGDTITLVIDDLSDVYFRADTGGDGLDYLAWR